MEEALEEVASLEEDGLSEEALEASERKWSQTFPKLWRASFF